MGACKSFPMGPPSGYCGASVFVLWDRYYPGMAMDFSTGVGKVAGAGSFFVETDRLNKRTKRQSALPET